MNHLHCPNCGNIMEQKKEPDITLDFCKNCSGTFFDHNELNVLATGLSGNIEYCSIDEDKHKDKFPSRKCPKCDDKIMRKINLLRFSDLIFDYCPDCEGFFLDKDEIEKMNYELSQLTSIKKAEEYRGYIQDHLVRLDKLSNVMVRPKMFGLFTSPTNVKYLSISVYFNKPLNAGLRIYSEKWTDKLLKTLQISKKQDIVIGNKKLDSYFIIQGEKTDKIKKLLSQDSIQEKLLAFIKNKPKMLYSTVTLEIFDERIICLEGPYQSDVNYNIEKDPAKILDFMMNLVTAIEENYHKI